MASDPPPALPTTEDHESSAVEVGFRILWLLAILLLATAILLGVRARPTPSVASDSARPAAAHFIDDGSTTRVGIDLADGENASRVIVTDPEGNDVFEITCYRGGRTDARCDDRRGTRATVTSGPDRGIGFHMNRKGASPRIGPRSGGRLLEIQWQEGMPAATPGQVWVQGGSTPRKAPAL